MIRRFGRPGLIGLAARTAVVAGTATAVTGGMRRHQFRKAQNEYEAEQYEAAQQAVAQPATPAATTAPAAAPADDLTSKLVQLSQLRDSGALSEDEYKKAVAEVLG